MRIYLLTGLLAMASCSVKPQENTMIADTSNTKLDSTINEKGVLVDSTKLIGMWTDKDNKGNPLFEIQKDSIFYPDQGKKFKYILSSADQLLIIFFDGYIYQCRVSFDRDTMIFKSYTDEQHYFKFKD